MPRHRDQGQSGLTLIELLVCLAITGVLLSLVLPSMNGWMQRLRLQSAADLLRADLQEARSLSIRQQSYVQVHFESDADGTCFIVHDGTPGACQCAADHQAQCTGSYRALRTQWVAASQQISIRNKAGDPRYEMRFEAGQGAVTPGATLVIKDEFGHVINAVISGAGRTRLCAQGTRFGGLPLCSVT
ncbi:MAG TPA: GspH/FimT family pseudopilin [Burkholderiaceae bacterium]|jgi:type IV fimbrial biogenesis protein FimT